MITPIDVLNYLCAELELLATSLSVGQAIGAPPVLEIIVGHFVGLRYATDRHTSTMNTDSAIRSDCLIEGDY